MTYLSPIIAALLGALAAALDRTASRLRRLAAALPTQHLPTARLLVVGGRRYVMMDDCSTLLPLEDA